MFMFMLVYTYYGGDSSPSTCVLWRRQFSVDMLRGGVGRGQGHASALSRERPTELEGHAGDPAERRGRGMGEHAGRGACGASMQGGLSRTTWPLTRVHLEVSGPAPGQWNSRTPAALTRVAFVGLSPGGRPTASPPGRDQREQDKGVRLGGPLARSQRAEVVTAPRVDGQLVQAG